MMFLNLKSLCPNAVGALNLTLGCQRPSNRAKSRIEAVVNLLRKLPDDGLGVGIQQRGRIPELPI